MAQVPINQNSFNTRNLQERTMQYMDMMATIEMKREAADMRKKEWNKWKREMNPNK